MSHYGEDDSNDSYEDFLEWRKYKKERRRERRDERERYLMALDTSSSSASAPAAAKSVAAAPRAAAAPAAAAKSVAAAAPAPAAAAAAVAAVAGKGKAEEVKVEVEGGGETLEGKSFQEKLAASNNKSALRKQVTAQVNKVLKQGSYTLNNGTQVELPAADIGVSRDGTKTYTGSEKWTQTPASSFSTTAHFVKADSIETALFLKDRKSVNPVVLIPADPSLYAGGNKGNESLEEQLFRRTSVGLALEESSYKIPEGGAIYVPDALVFRDSEQKTGYAWFSAPRKVSFILAASERNPKYETVNRVVQLEQSAAEKTKATMRTILRVALEQKHDAIVLTAWGAGYNGNPPAALAALWRELLTKEFTNAFKHVTFAMLDGEPGAHNPQGNVAPFQTEFLTVRRPANQGCC